MENTTLTIIIVGVIIVSLFAIRRMIYMGNQKKHNTPHSVVIMREPWWYGWRNWVNYPIHRDIGTYRHHQPGPVRGRIGNPIGHHREPIRR